MFEKFSLEAFSLMLVYDLAKAIIKDIGMFAFSDQKKLIQGVRKFHGQLQSIINNAERIFTLIQNADKQIKDYGDSNFTKIIQEDFIIQAERIREIAKNFSDPDMSSILENVDDNLRLQLNRALNPKMSSIFRAIRLMEHSTFKVENGQLFVVQDQKKFPAFPDIDNQLEILLKLKSCSKSLWEIISSRLALKI